MKYLLFSFFVSVAVQSYAQTADTTSHSDSVYTSVMVEARFPGGAKGWQTFLEQTLKVNTPVKHRAPAGSYNVLVSFLVLKNGTVTEAEVLNDPGYGCAQEAVRVLKKNPKWNPATINGAPVVYRQKQSITFLVD